jgi:4-hydroxymandelate synthase
MSAAHPAAEYVRRHGDGVAVVAFAVDDAAVAFDEAVSQGAGAIEPPAVYEAGFSKVTFAAVTGFGDVAHRFVQRHGPAEDFAPGLISQTTQADTDCGDADLLDTIDHIAVCVPTGTLTEVVDRYGEVFGLSQIFEERIEVGRQAMDSKVVQCPSGSVTFTLLEPAGAEPGQIDQFLKSHGGAGVQHVAFATDDIATAVRAFEGRGVRFLTTPPAYYDELQRRLGLAEIPV